MTYAKEAVAFVTVRRMELKQKEADRRKSGQRISAERTRNYEKFMCHECQLPHAQMFMVQDEVWALAKFAPAALVCFSCFVRAMPRPLVIEDFKPCLTNEMLFHAYTMGLQAAQNAQG